MKVYIWYPNMGLRCIMPPRQLNQLKTPAIPLIETQCGQELCRPWYIFHGISIQIPSTIFFSNIKVDIWHPAVGLRCIIPPRHSSQFKALVIHLTLAPSGKRTLRPSVIFHRICIGSPPNAYIKVDIWHAAVGLMCIIPPRHLRQLKTQGIPLI
jgi:hypothetical protein